MKRVGKAWLRCFLHCFSYEKLLLPHLLAQDAILTICEKATNILEEEKNCGPLSSENSFNEMRRFAVTSVIEK
jgi:hypothetical protein